MKEIKLWIHDGRTYMEPHWTTEQNVIPGIREWGESVLPYAKEKDKQHCIYATRETNPDGHTVEVNYYCVCLDDEDFFKRTDAVVNEAHEKGNDIIVYAFHKGTTY